MNSKPVRVLQVVGGMNVGGAETMLMNLYRNIDREKIQFDFLVFYDGYYDREIKELGGRVIKIPETKKSGLLKTLKNMKNVICEYGPYRAVHAHTLFNAGLAMKAAKMSNVHIRIAHSHTTHYQDQHSSKNMLKHITKSLYAEIMRYLIINCSTHFAACSKEAAIFLFGNRALNFFTINNGIDVERFTNLNQSDIDKIKQEFNIDEKTLVIGSIGRLEKVKNHSFMVKLVKFITKHESNIKFLIVGTGSLEKELVQLVNELGIQDKVVFTGLRQDIPQLLHVFDFILMPSLYEGLPVTLIEAQAAGVPCVISDAITREADLKLGLVNYVSLNKDLHHWYTQIAKLGKVAKPSKELIITRIKQMGFDVKENVIELYKLYGLHT